MMDGTDKSNKSIRWTLLCGSAPESVEQTISNFPKPLKTPTVNPTQSISFVDGVPTVEDFTKFDYFIKALSVLK
jgi:hypothetical protein